MSGDHLKGRQVPFSDETFRRVLAILKALPILKSAENQVEEAAAGLCEWAQIVVDDKEITTEMQQGVRRLPEIIRLCDELIAHIRFVYHSPVRHVIYPGATPDGEIDFTGESETSHHFPLEFIDQLENLKKTASYNSSAGRRPARGAPRKEGPQTVTWHAADIYERLTGTEATVATRDGKAEGPYLDYLTSIFNAVGIVASPESQAREVRALRKKISTSKPN